jgi:hypothetical protein
VSVQPEVRKSGMKRNKFKKEIAADHVEEDQAKLRYLPSIPEVRH